MRLKIGGERNYFSAFSITYRIKNCNGASKVIFSKNNFLNRKDKPPARHDDRKSGAIGDSVHFSSCVNLSPRSIFDLNAERGYAPIGILSKHPSVELCNEGKIYLLPAFAFV